MGYLYIATPYWSDDPKIREWRTRYAARLHRDLHSYGVMAYVPIAYTAIELDPLIPEDHWYEFGITMLSRSSGMALVHLDGWQNSKGMKLEEEFARENKIPVTTSTSKFVDVLAACRYLARLTA